VTAATGAAQSGAGRRLGTAAGNNSSSNKSKKPRAPKSSLFVVLLAVAAQLALLLLLVDEATLRELVEDFPLSTRNQDVTLPSVLFAALRLQTSDGAQARLFVGVFFVALIQGLIVAKSVADCAAPPIEANADEE
jgi:hypothetical protein